METGSKLTSKECQELIDNVAEVAIMGVLNQCDRIAILKVCKEAVERAISRIEETVIPEKCAPKNREQ